MNNTTKQLCIAGLSAFAFSLNAQAAVLSVNLGKDGLIAETGFTNWTATDRQTAAPTTTIGGIGLTFNQLVAESGRLRAINRSQTYTGTLGNLTTSWWGGRKSASGAGGQFELVINGADLGAGSFDWTSWHHEQSNQTGKMTIDFSVNGGSAFTTALTGFDIVDNTTDGNVGAPNPATLSFVSNGTDDIHIRFTNTSGSNSTNDFVVINGFQVVAVPEPSSAVFGGLCALMMLLRRRR